MKSLLLLFLLLGFTSSSWAEYFMEDKPSETIMEDLADNNDLVIQTDDGDINDESVGNSYTPKEFKTEKKKSINQGQIRKNGWQQKPTSIKKKPLNFKRK